MPCHSGETLSPGRTSNPATCKYRFAVKRAPEDTVTSRLSCASRTDFMALSANGAMICGEGKKG